jgi:hypothetical protein
MLQTGVDFTCRLRQLTPRRYGNGAARDRSVDVARNDHHNAARGQLRPAAERRHELDATAGGFQYAAEISAVFNSIGR